MRIDQIEKKAEEFEISVESAIMMRRRYLAGLLDAWSAYISEETDVIPESDIGFITAEMISLSNYKERKKTMQSKNSITDEMVALAREYPIESVIEFARGKAVAFCHPDKNPSLSLDRKRNRCHCFVCDKDFSALDVLIERDNLSFVEAVKSLGGGI